MTSGINNWFLLDSQWHFKKKKKKKSCYVPPLVRSVAELMPVHIKGLQNTGTGSRVCTCMNTCARSIPLMSRNGDWGNEYVGALIVGEGWITTPAAILVLMDLKAAAVTPVLSIHTPRNCQYTRESDADRSLQFQVFFIYIHDIFARIHVHPGKKKQPNS